MYHLAIYGKENNKSSYSIQLTIFEYNSYGLMG